MSGCGHCSREGYYVYVAAVVRYTISDNFDMSTGGNFHGCNTLFNGTHQVLQCSARLDAVITQQCQMILEREQAGVMMFTRGGVRYTAIIFSQKWSANIYATRHCNTARWGIWSVTT